jgi:hypothetical protein
MSDPLPLKDDPDAPATLRRWLSEAPRAVPFDEARRARLRHRVIAGAAGAAILALAWKALAAILVTATIGAVAWTATRPDVDDPPRSTPSARPARVAPVNEPTNEPTAEPTATEPAEPTATESVEPARTIRREPVERSLADETELLRRAGTLVVRSPRAALGVLKRHERRYPDGALVGERELLTIEALRNLGRTEAALRRARATAARFSGSLVGRRANELADELARGSSR